jgi:hypothetical protein
MGDGPFEPGVREVAVVTSGDNAAVGLPQELC